MTLSEMAVLAIDEILLRTEISGRGEEGLGVGRPNGPGVGTAATSAALPHDAARLRFGTGRGAGTAATSAALPHDTARLHFGTGRGVGTAATSAALPHDAARLHFGTGPARVRPRQARPSRMTPRGATPPRRRKMRFHCVINLESRRGARRDPFGRNELRLFLPGDWGEPEVVQRLDVTNSPPLPPPVATLARVGGGAEWAEPSFYPDLLFPDGFKVRLTGRASASRGAMRPYRSAAMPTTARRRGARRSSILTFS